jgi:hypothetical protein
VTVAAGERAAPAPPLGWAFATAFLCLLLPARTGVVVELGLGAAGFAGMVVFGGALRVLLAIGDVDSCSSSCCAAATST